MRTGAAILLGLPRPTKSNRLRTGTSHGVIHRCYTCSTSVSKGKSVCKGRFGGLVIAAPSLDVKASNARHRAKAWSIGSARAPEARSLAVLRKSRRGFRQCHCSVVGGQGRRHGGSRAHAARCLRLHLDEVLKDSSRCNANCLRAAPRGSLPVSRQGSGSLPF
jgi:hypothetical protein